VVAVAAEGVRADWDGDGQADAYALLQVSAAAEGVESADWTARVNEALSARGFPTLTGTLRMDASEVTKGATGKVLKREMRERFRARVASGEFDGVTR
jgi:hypothetical protein